MKRKPGSAVPGYVGPDTRAYDAAITHFDSPEYMEMIEHRWRTVWALRFGLDPALKGRARALAMAKATGLLGVIPKATREAMEREPGQDLEEDAYRDVA